MESENPNRLLVIYRGNTADVLMTKIAWFTTWKMGASILYIVKAIMVTDSSHPTSSRIRTNSSSIFWAVSASRRKQTPTAGRVLAISTGPAAW